MTKSKKNQRKIIALTFAGILFYILLIAVLLRGNDVVLLNPKGVIAEGQYRLMMTSTLIMVLFAAPILFTLYYFAWKYRETNKKASYNPDSSRGKSVTLAIWGAPTIIAVILASIMVPATHKLAPQRLIESDKDLMTIQVVALRWKWLFIYPEQGIATVNYVQIPKDTPVQFELTADETPMSSFWIPSLGGMLYAMTEHVNRLNLMGDTVGDYDGSAAEINGTGFSGMKFTTRVSTQEDFDKWVDSTRLSPIELSTSEYDKLLEPTKNQAAAFFTSPDPNLYDIILSKYSDSHGAVHGGEKNDYMEHGGKKKEMDH